VIFYTPGNYRLIYAHSVLAHIGSLPQKVLARIASQINPRFVDQKETAQIVDIEAELIDGSA
jgi:hypothetical protein